MFGGALAAGLFAGIVQPLGLVWIAGFAVAAFKFSQAAAPSRMRTLSAAGGPTYVVLSTVAGVGYGRAYLHAGNRIEASLLAHFTLNAVHFLGFTYPALSRAI